MEKTHCRVLCWLLISSWHKPSERRKLQLGKSHTRMACGQIYREFHLSMIDVGEPNPTVGSARLGQVVLGYDMTADWTNNGKQAVISVPPWPLLQFLPLCSCLEFPLWLSLRMNHNLKGEINPVLPKFFLVSILSQQYRTRTCECLIKNKFAPALPFPSAFHHELIHPEDHDQTPC